MGKQGHRWVSVSLLGECLCLGKQMGLNLLSVFAASTFDRSEQEADTKGDWKHNCGWAGKFILL